MGMDDAGCQTGGGDGGGASVAGVGSGVDWREFSGRGGVGWGIGEAGELSAGDVLEKWNPPQPESIENVPIKSNKDSGYCRGDESLSGKQTAGDLESQP